MRHYDFSNFSTLNMCASFIHKNDMDYTSTHPPTNFCLSFHQLQTRESCYVYLFRTNLFAKKKIYCNGSKHFILLMSRSKLMLVAILILSEV